jgi:hypothetical protein
MCTLLRNTTSKAIHLTHMRIQITAIALSVATLFGSLPDTATAQNNFASTDPFLPLFGTYQVHYEHTIYHRISLTVGVGVKTSSGLFEINGVETETMDLDDLDFHGYKILPEIRWYVSKDNTGLWGFYTGAYYKYQKNETRITGDYVTSDGSSVDVDMDLDLTSNTGGIELGYKLRVWKGLFMDFIFAGIGLSAHHAVFTERASLPEKFYERFNEAADNFSILKELEPKLDITKEDLDTRFVAPHFRYGIKIGWSF